MCLEGLGLPRAGSVLPVLRGAGPPGDQHEEKKVAVVLQWQCAESQLCKEGGPRGIHSDRPPVFRAGGTLTSGRRREGEEVCHKARASSCAQRVCPLASTNKTLRHEKSVIPQQT